MSITSNRRPPRPTVAMFVMNDMRLDSRVHREASTLAQSGRDVTVYAVLSDGTKDRPVESVHGYRIVRVPMLMRPTGAGASAESPLVSGGLNAKHILAAAFAATRPLFGGTLHLLANWQMRWRPWWRRVEAQVTPAEVWHAHDFNTLGLAVRCAERHGGAVVYDSHEVFMEAGAMSVLPRFVRAILRRIQRRLAARADAILTVNDSIADVLRQRLDFPDVRVVRNCADPLPKRFSPLRAAIGVGPDVPVILYHGSMAVGRGLELLLASMRDPRLEGAHLVYMGYGPLRPRIQHLAAVAPAADRIHFLPPVAPVDVTTWVAGADVAAMPIEPTTLNHRLSSPNKMFEAIAAGVPVVGPDFVEFRRVIAENRDAPLGAIHRDHTPLALASALSSVLAMEHGASERLRDRCRLASRRRWNWAMESTSLIETYAALSSRAAPSGSRQWRRAAMVSATTKPE